MIPRYLKFAAPALSLLLASGCGHHPSVSDPLPVNQIRATLQAAFKSADAATRDTANKVADELDQHQVVAAYGDLNDLLSLQNLSDEQAIDAVRANNTVAAMVREAAQNGDAQAAAAVQAVRHH